MLYPKEDQHNNQLMFSCRSCHYAEPATAACVYRNSLQEQIAETAGNVEDVAQDPTVGDEPSFASAADSCIGDGAFTALDCDEDSDLPRICTYCGKEILCPICGEASDGGVFLEVPDTNQRFSDEQEEVLVEAERQERMLSNTNGYGQTS